LAKIIIKKHIILNFKKYSLFRNDLLFLEKIKNMRKIDQLFAEYAESHQNKTNKLIHWICVPLIFFTIVGFISLIPAPHFCCLFWLYQFGKHNCIDISKYFLC
jgi:hypothetical protein